MMFSSVKNRDSFANKILTATPLQLAIVAFGAFELLLYLLVFV
jgi:hypothetical protein